MSRGDPKDTDRQEIERLNRYIEPEHPDPTQRIVFICVSGEFIGEVIDYDPEAPKGRRLMRGRFRNDRAP